MDSNDQDNFGKFEFQGESKLCPALFFLAPCVWAAIIFALTLPHEFCRLHPLDAADECGGAGRGDVREGEGDDGLRLGRCQQGGPR